MTTPFDQQPQPVPPSEGTNDAPEDRANAPTVPNTVPAGQPNVASDGATTTPMAPATASQRPAGAPFDRVYAVSPQQLFQVIHDQLTTGATFTLDNENTQTGAFSFHSYDGVNCTLTVVPQGAAGAAIRLEESHPLGRLWDIDVFQDSPEAVSRETVGAERRTCLLCGRDAKECARSRRHDIRKLQDKVTEIIAGWQTGNRT